MEDDKKTQSDDTQKSDNNEAQAGKSFTQEDVNKIVSERLSEVKTKFEKELLSRIETERTDAERLAKLSAEEREKELLLKSKSELDAKERELNIKANTLDAQTQLIEAKIPLSFLNFVVSENIDDQQKKIETLKENLSKAVTESVENQLKGTPPKDISNNSNTTKTALKDAY